MNTISAKIKKVITDTCVVNTVIMTLLYILGYLTNKDGGTAWIPKFNIMWMVLGVSFVLALAERILDMKGSLGARIACHFGMCVVGFLLIFIIGGGYSSSAGAVVVGTFLFILAYILVNGVRFAVTGKLRRAKNETEEYTSVFGRK